MFGRVEPSKPAVTAPIVGATKLTHIEDAVSAVDVSLSDSEVALLEAPYRPHAILGHAWQSTPANERNADTIDIATSAGSAFRDIEHKAVGSTSHQCVGKSIGAEVKFVPGVASRNRGS